MTFYNEGYEAFQNGGLFASCPYHRGTAGYKYWYEGWNAAFAFFLENVA